MLTIQTAAQKLQSRETTSVQLAQDFFQHIEQKDGDLNSYIALTKELALEQAAAADQKRKEGDTNPLLGIPLGIKDCFNVQGELSRSASKILENYHPQYEGPALQRLRQAGSVFLGKTNTDEFTCGASTEHSAYGVTKNPHDTDRVAGGSSGGSAAAVAAGLCVAAMGTDTGGSIRQPAAFCGVVGLKNTYGRIPRYGVIPMASSLDTIGTLAQTVEDTALLMNAIAGPDASDATTPDEPVPNYLEKLKDGVNGLKIGIPQEYFVDGMEQAVEQSVRAAIEQLKKAGAEIVDISLPHTKYAIPAYYIIAPSEVSSNMARFDGVRFGPTSENAQSPLEHYLEVRGRGFGEEVKRRIMIGTHVLSSGYYDAYYHKAQQIRTLIRNDFEEAFQAVDVIAAPTTPTTAFKIGDNTEDPLKMYLADVLTAPINLAGLPALSVPCGMAKPEDGGQKELPIGIQFIGNRFTEDLLLQVGFAHEQQKNA